MRILSASGVFTVALVCMVAHTPASAQSGTFSVVPSFGAQNSGSIIGGQPQNSQGGVVPSLTGSAANSQSSSGVNVPTGVSGNGCTKCGATQPPFKMVEQVRIDSGENGVLTQSVMQGASNLTAVANSVESLK